MSYIGNKIVKFEIAKGNVPSHRTFHLTGFNVDVDAAEDIWTQGGDFVPPTTARVHNLVSSSAADDDGSTGANTVTVSGIGSSGNELTELVTMDGTSNVATTNSYTMINSLTVATSGTGLVNAGLITATAVTDATVTCAIPAGHGRSMQAVYQVPRGTTMHMDSWAVSAGTINGSTSECTAILMEKPSGGSWNAIARIVVPANNMQAVTEDLGYSESLTGGTMIKVRATAVGDVNLDISSDLLAVLVGGMIPTSDAILHEDGLGYLLHEDGGVILHE